MKIRNIGPEVEYKLTKADFTRHNIDDQNAVTFKGKEPQEVSDAAGEYLIKTNPKAWEEVVDDPAPEVEPTVDDGDVGEPDDLEDVPEPAVGGWQPPLDGQDDDES